MKKFSITLDSFVVGVVEAFGNEATYDHKRDFNDYVVRNQQGQEVLRVAREHILCVTITEVASS